MPRLSTIPSYRKFINARDRVLEKLHQRCQKETSDIARAGFEVILFSVGHNYRKINDATRFTSRGRAILDTIERDIILLFARMDNEFLGPVDRLHKRGRLLAYAGELEAISRVTGIQHHSVLPVAPENSARLKATLEARTLPLKNKIIGILESAYVDPSRTADQVYASVVVALPKPLRYVRPPNELRPLKEADEWASDAKASATLNFINDSQWRDLIDAYKNEYIPKGRDLAFDVEIGQPELEEWYGWEIEREITHGYLEQVKSGQIDAANQAGVTDLMWTSVLDDRTREEHRLKDGLTSTEIEDKLGGEWADFDDQSTVAPGGFGCRCRSVPYLKDIPEAPPVDYGDFDTWLDAP